MIHRFKEPCFLPRLFFLLFRAIFRFVDRYRFFISKETCWAAAWKSVILFVELYALLGSRSPSQRRSFCKHYEKRHVLGLAAICLRKEKGPGMGVSDAKAQDRLAPSVAKRPGRALYSSWFEIALSAVFIYCKY